jgi:hypothetical protein
MTLSVTDTCALPTLGHHWGHWMPETAWEQTAREDKRGGHLRLVTVAWTRQCERCGVIERSKVKGGGRR